MDDQMKLPVAWEEYRDEDPPAQDPKASTSMGVIPLAGGPVPEWWVR